MWMVVVGTIQRLGIVAAPECSLREASHEQILGVHQEVLDVTLVVTLVSAGDTQAGPLPGTADASNDWTLRAAVA